LFINETKNLKPKKKKRREERRKPKKKKKEKRKRKKKKRKKKGRNFFENVDKPPIERREEGKRLLEGAKGPKGK